jgi:hypothetical protein
MASINQEATDFIYQHTKDATEAQMRHSRALDSKLVWLFSAASVVIGLVASSTSRPPISVWLIAPLVGALAAYLIVAGCAVFGLWPRQYRTSAGADTMWPNYYDVDPGKIEHAVVQDIADAYSHNKRQFAGREKALALATGFLAIEVTMISLHLIFSLVVASPLL